MAAGDAPFHRIPRCSPTAATGLDAADTFDASVLRFNRNKSVRISEALWYRSFLSFSNALLTMRSSSGDQLALACVSRIGERFRIASWMTAAVLPEKAIFPVAIS